MSDIKIISASTISRKKGSRGFARAFGKAMADLKPGQGFECPNSSTYSYVVSIISAFTGHHYRYVVGDGKVRHIVRES